MGARGRAESGERRVESGEWGVESGNGRGKRGENKKSWELTFRKHLIDKTQTRGV